MVSVAGALHLLLRIAIWGGLLLLFVLWMYELAISLQQATTERNLVDWWLQRKAVSPRGQDSGRHTTRAKH
jgi:hypothetical protein